MNNGIFFFINFGGGRMIIRNKRGTLKAWLAYFGDGEPERTIVQESNNQGYVVRSETLGQYDGAGKSKIAKEGRWVNFARLAGWLK